MRLIEKNQFFNFSQYDFNDLFKIDKVEDELPPLNFKLRSILKNKPDKFCDGIGIYFFTEKIKSDHWKLVYVGIRVDGNAIKKTLLGLKDKSNFSKERIKKHLATDTFRFKNAFPISSTQFNSVKGTNKTKISKRLKEFTDSAKNIDSSSSLSELCNYINNNPFNWYWRKEGSWNLFDRQLFSKGRKLKTHGIVTSYRRFAYAGHNWEFFGKDRNISNTSFNQNFSYYFIQFTKDYFDNFCKFSPQAKKSLKLLKIKDQRTFRNNLKSKVMVKYFENPLIKEKPLTNERNNSKNYYAYWRKQQYTNSDKLAQQLFNKIKDPKDFIYF